MRENPVLSETQQTGRATRAGRWWACVGKPSGSTRPVLPPGATRGRPPIGLGVTCPSLRSRADQRLTLAALTPKRQAASRHEAPPDTKATTRSRGSTDNGDGIGRLLPNPITPHANPRSNLLGNGSKTATIQACTKRDAALDSLALREPTPLPPEELRQVLRSLSRGCYGPAASRAACLSMRQTKATRWRSARVLA